MSDHGPSIKGTGKIYAALRRKGYTKTLSAKINNAMAKRRASKATRKARRRSRR